MSVLSTDTRPGFALPLLLLLGFQTLVDQLHAELADQGHPDARPAHGFALQAIGPDGITATELGRRLGVSKQAAAKTITSRIRRIPSTSPPADMTYSRAPLGSSTNYERNG